MSTPSGSGTGAGAIEALVGTIAGAVEHQLQQYAAQVQQRLATLQQQLVEQSTMLTQRIDFTEHKVTDRMLAMEDRVNDENGTKIANLEATIGRIGAGFDEALGALSQRMLDLENRLYAVDDALGALRDKMADMGDEGIAALKEQMSAAVGEAMLVRIELDRFTANTDEKIDRSNLRMAEIEAQLSDSMDVTAAVQLERLEEIERALVELDPAQFVRTDGRPGTAPAGLTHTSGAPSAAPATMATTVPTTAPAVPHSTTPPSAGPALPTLPHLPDPGHAGG